MKIQTLALVLALAIGGVGHAMAQTTTDVVSQTTTIDKTQRVDAIVDQQNRIRADIKASCNGWDGLSQDKRDEVLKDQDRLFALLQGKQVIGDLQPDRQVEAANLLESIKAVAMNAEDERMICTRERKMGSNFTQRVCRTVGQLRREREAARDGLRRADEMQRMQPKQSGSM